LEDSIVTQKAFKFSLNIISLYKLLTEEKEYVLSKQLLRSATSIGANIEEATAGQSKKDFIAKMAIASKEARETRYWLQLLQQSQLVKSDYTIYLSSIEEIIKILTSIVKTSQQK
jgi:four helix bundle protein